MASTPDTPTKCPRANTAPRIRQVARLGTCRCRTTGDKAHEPSSFVGVGGKSSNHGLPCRRRAKLTVKTESISHFLFLWPQTLVVARSLEKETRLP